MTQLKTPTEGHGSYKVKLYRWKKKYKAGDIIGIETDSREYLQQAKKEYARKRKKAKN